MSRSIEEVTAAIRQFRDERDWLQFHNPKDMAAALSIEAAELLEHFLWKTKEEAEARCRTHREAVSEEIADIGCYLFELVFEELTPVRVSARTNPFPACCLLPLLGAAPIRYDAPCHTGR